MSWDDLFNLNLDEIFLVAPASEPEPEVTPEVGEAELTAVKTMVANVKELNVCQLSNLSVVTDKFLDH